MPLDAVDKLRLLGGDSTIEAERDAYTSLQGPRRGDSGFPGVYRAAVAGGRRIPLLRALQTNVCQLDCRYCSINRHRDVRRVSFKPEELAAFFMQLHARGTVAGLFLSSGVAGGPAKAQERMLTTVAILRERHGFRGYVHLKLMPGLPDDYVEESARLADRLSINLEAPTPEHLAYIAPSKDLQRDLLAPMETVGRLYARRPESLRAGQVTQLVVGAAGESDRTILRRARQTYAIPGVRRVYYSAYHPVCGEVLAPTTPVLREHRLYQADWLMRLYRLTVEDLTYDDAGNLPLRVDPKLMWALRHRDRFPIEVNRAAYADLILVPGIGPLSARRIVSARRREPLKTLVELRAVGVVVKRAAHFITVNGRYYAGRDELTSRLTATEPVEAQRQLSLWAAPEPERVPSPV